MTTRTALALVALAFVAFGAGLLLLPDLILGTIAGVELNAGAVVLARLVGGMNLAVGAAVWLMRDARQQQVLLALALGEAIHAPIIAWATSAGIMNGVGWLIAAASAAIGLGLVYGARTGG